MKLWFCWRRYLLGEEAEASPSVGNIVWHVWTTFTRSAITPPEVNGFGWNLEHFEYIVWSWPWYILGAICVEARAGARADFFVRWITNDFTDFRSVKFHEICTQDVVLRRGESFWNEIFKIFPQGVVFFPKPTSSRTTSDFIPQLLCNDIDWWKVTAKWAVYGMSSFHSYRWNQLKVIPLDSKVCTGNDFHRRILAERLASACSLDVTLQIH